MDVDSEKFASLKELSKIQLQIANGRAELDKLKRTTEEYEKTREKGALERVKKALEASKNALSEAEKNRDTLALFLTSASEVVANVKKLHQDIKNAFAEFDIQTKEISDIVEQKTEAIVSGFNALRIQRHALESERGGFEQEKRQFEKDKKIFNDRKEAQERQKKRLEGIKI